MLPGHRIALLFCSVSCNEIVKLLMQLADSLSRAGKVFFMLFLLVIISDFYAFRQ